MKKLIILCGMIGSGKTTWARNYIKKNPGTLIISKDDIRRMLHGGEYVYDEALEESIDWTANSFWRELEDDYAVILDDCHLSKADRNIDRWDATETIIVSFPPKDKQWHVDGRMLNSYGHSLECWERVYDKMIAVYEPPTEDECDELIVIKD